MLIYLLELYVVLPAGKLKMGSHVRSYTNGIGKRADVNSTIGWMINPWPLVAQLDMLP